MLLHGIVLGIFIMVAAPIIASLFPLMLFASVIGFLRFADLFERVFTTKAEKEKKRQKMKEYLNTPEQRRITAEFKMLDALKELDELNAINKQLEQNQRAN